MSGKIAINRLMLVSSAFAVTLTPLNAQDAGGEIELGQIVVTARKVEEDPQRIPFGISVFGRDRLTTEDIRDARTFGSKTPGYNFVDTGVRGSNTPNIRGVGSFFPQSSDDSSVPVFIDGVPVALRAQDRELFDIERIEVLRGPQSSIFGRNAQAGAINITTSAPTQTPFFQIGSEYGSFDAFQVTGIASGPITDTLAGRVSAKFDQRNGDIPDRNLGTKLRDHKLGHANGKLVWQPTNNTSATLSMRYGNYDERPTGGWFEDPNFPQTFFDFAPQYDLETLGTGFTVKHDAGPFNFTSVTGFQHYTSQLNSDDSDGVLFSALTGLPPALFNDPGANFRQINDKDYQFTQELRLDGELANGLKWLAGTSLFYSDLDFDFLFNSTGFINATFANKHMTTSISGFGEVTVPISERLNAIAGLRITSETKAFRSRAQDLSIAMAPSQFDSGTETFNFATGRFGLTYDFMPTLTGFASVARGAKSGGFQLADTDLLNGISVSEYDSAFTMTYEAGLRGTLLDEMLNVSLSGFFNDTADEHVQVFIPPTFQAEIVNLDTETYGFEFEGALKPADGVTLSASVAVLETEIVKSADPTVAVGNKVPFAPDVTFNLTGEYRHPLSVLAMEGEAYGRVEYQYVGKRTVDPQNSFNLQPFDLLNFRAGWTSENVTVYGFVTNALDRTYGATAFLFGASPAGARVSAGVAGQPRRWGVGARIRF